MVCQLLIMFGNLLGVRVKLNCSEKVDKNEKFIVIMNHQSCLDIIPMSHILLALGDLAPVVRKAILYVQPFGLAVKVSDGMFLENGKKNASRKVLNDKIFSLKSIKHNLAMFPEGTRCDSEQLLPFKKGAFHMSVQSGMRILPVVVQKYHFINHQKKIFGRGEVKVNILDPIEKKNVENIDEFTNRAYEIMNNKFKQLNSN